MHWRRKWQPTPVFLPGESQGWRSLVGCRLWGCTESDTIEVMQQQQQLQQDMHMGKRIEMDNLNTCSLLLRETDLNNYSSFPLHFSDSMLLLLLSHFSHV